MFKKSLGNILHNNQLVDVLARVVCLFLFTLWSTLLIIKFNFFGFYDWDLALYDGLMQSIIHGRQTVSLLGGHWLLDHAHLGAFLLSPIYKLFPHPLTLLHLELLSVFGGGYILYLISKELLGNAFVALVFMLAYFLHPANSFMLLYEFHFESLSIGIVFLSLYFSIKQRYIPFLICSLLLLLIKENLILLVLSLAVVNWFYHKEDRWRWCGVPLLMGMVYFVFMMFVLIPSVRRAYAIEGASVYWTLYEPLLRHPLTALSEYLLSEERWLYFIHQMGGYLFLFILKPFAFLSAIPLLAQNFLSKVYSQHTIFFHYSATLLPLLAFGGIEAWRHFSLKAGKKLIRFSLGVYIALVLYSFISFYPQMIWRMDRWADKEDPYRLALLQEIPQGASVVASFEFLSHLTGHENLYAFYSVWRDKNVFTGKSPWVMPVNIDYAIINWQDPWLLADKSQDPVAVKARIDAFMKANQLVLKQSYGPLALYKSSL